MTYDLSDKSQLSMFILAEDYEPDSVRFLSPFLELSSKFIDVGAHIGKFTIPIAAAFPNVKVLAVEPYFENISRLKTHSHVNNVQVQIIEAAVTTESNPRFTTVHGFSGWGYVDAEGEHSVDGVRLDSLASESCVLKVDVEGEEFRVLESARMRLKEQKFTAIAIEVRPDTINSVINILDQNKYLIHNRQPTGRIQILFATPRHD